ncbi:SurA N-terminal domain-containing protein [Bilophila wadsworthia]|uniref:SurA N-terminal domain-containing protein n=1 Tax=Bilophila wadsworthia TaxID=35833 RepID=UPI00266DC958|nr:SurA N-terminal domain-containing protein [Bilophila wadsworthia]
MRIVSTAFLLFFLITSPVRAAINGVAAVVNGEMITAFDLQAETAPEAMRRGLNPKDPNQAAAIEELTKATLERMINNIILTQEAQRLKISVGDAGRIPASAPDPAHDREGFPRAYPQQHFAEPPPCQHGRP